jgi:AcrR family transcriptional regulator
MSEQSYRERLHGRAIEITRRIVEAEGLEAVQARRIAREADCAVGSLYNVFGDIDGLILAMNGETLAALGLALGEASAACEQLPLEARLRTLALGYARFAVDNPRLWQAVFHHRRPAGSAVPADYLALQARLLALIEAAIADRIADGEARTRAARALFGAVHGIVALAIDERLGGAVAPELEQQVSFLVALIARGLNVGGAAS